MKGVSKMSVKIIDEKQIRKTRLLILDSNPPQYVENKVKIGNEYFDRLDLYDMKNAIAIVCDENMPTFIGKTV